MPVPLQIDAFSSVEDFRSAAFMQRIETAKLEDSTLAPNQPEPFVLKGFCQCCNTASGFLVDYQNAFETVRGIPQPNWRETVLCPVCRLNARARGLVHLLSDDQAVSFDQSSIYISEQLTPLFAYLAERCHSLVGSEYLSASAEPGSTDQRGLRHEDLTRLSFANESFDIVMSFDVLEHIPNYRNALSELARVTRPGGQAVLSVPMNLYRPETTVRAEMLPSGELHHLLPPEYHGDPVHPAKGVLCFYHFGWDILKELEFAGFTAASLQFYRSRDHGYPGAHQYAIRAIK